MYCSFLFLTLGINNIESNIKKYCTYITHLYMIVNTEEYMTGHHNTLAWYLGMDWDLRMTENNQKS